MKLFWEAIEWKNFFSDLSITWGISSIFFQVNSIQFRKFTKMKITLWPLWLDRYIHQEVSCNWGPPSRSAGYMSNYRIYRAKFQNTKYDYIFLARCSKRWIVFLFVHKQNLFSCGSWFIPCSSWTEPVQSFRSRIGIYEKYISIMNYFTSIFTYSFTQLYDFRRKGIYIHILKLSFIHN